MKGKVALTANASDNAGVAGVQFLLDGTALGAEDTTAPYSRVLEHDHGRQRRPHADRVARDAAGNTATSRRSPSPSTTPTQVTVVTAPATGRPSLARWP